MRYVILAWKYDGEIYKVAHDLGQEYDAKEIADWMRDELRSIEYPHFAFAEIDAAKFEWYKKRKLTLDNF